MKKQFFTLFLFLAVLIFTSAFITKSSNGSVPGFTGSPGELTCSGGGGCHGGGSSAAKGVTITATPSFSLDQYMPDSTYVISVQVSATGFNRYGFGCEILDSINGDAGIMQGAGSGVKFQFAGNGRKNALHTTPKFGTNSTTFTFHWVAPPQGSVTIYVCGNAVNLSGNTLGDIPLPTSLGLTAAPLPIDTTTPPDTTGIHEIKSRSVSQISVYPNPANQFGNISYYLNESKTITVELIDIKGNKVKEFFNEKQNPGYYSQILNLQHVASGVYFIKTSANHQKVSQKLITIE